jgi:hypothetical protein
MLSPRANKLQTQVKNNPEQAYTYKSPQPKAHNKSP